MNPRRGAFYLILVLFCGLVGCQSKYIIEERVLPRRNPTTHEFNYPIGKVKEAIEKVRGSKWHDDQKLHERPVLAWKGTENPFATKIFDDPKNENDAFLCGVGLGESVGKSNVYLKDGQQLTYYADFQIHLTSISPDQTRVEIKTFDSHVLAGTEWHPFAVAGIYLVVEPTSVEEYEILLDIGKQLDVLDMPTLIFPDSKSATKKVKEPRRR
jgi:hypothetical protein